MYIVGFLILVYVGIHIAFFGEAHRHQFGTQAGNVLLLAEVTALAVAAICIGLWRSGRRHAATAVGLLLVSTFFAFLGWMIHPTSRYERAHDRVNDWERAVAEFREEQRTSRESEEQRMLRWKRLSQELAARRLELQAAEVRYNGEPAFFRSPFPSWLMWFNALVAIVAGVVTIRLPNSTIERDARKSGARPSL